MWVITRVDKSSQAGARPLYLMGISVERRIRTGSSFYAILDQFLYKLIVAFIVDIVAPHVVRLNLRQSIRLGSTQDFSV